jgi:hypothetical protein
MFEGRNSAAFHQLHARHQLNRLSSRAKREPALSEVEGILVLANTLSVAASDKHHDPLLRSG